MAEAFRDGFEDLVVHFPVPDFVIDPSTADGDVVTLTLTSELDDGTPFEGEDDVTVKVPTRSQSPIPAKVAEKQSNGAFDVKLARASSFEVALVFMPNVLCGEWVIILSLIKFIVQPARTLRAIAS